MHFSTDTSSSVVFVISIIFMKIKLRLLKLYMQEYVWLLSSVYTWRCITLIWHFFGLPISNNTIIGSFRNHDDNRDKNVTNLDIWQWKTIVLHALHVQCSFLYISLTFSSFPWREMISFCSCVDDVSIKWQIFDISCYLQTAGYLEYASITTWNNLEIIAEARSYSFRWHSRWRQRH